MDFIANEIHDVRAAVRAARLGVLVTPAQGDVRRPVRGTSGGGDKPAMLLRSGTARCIPAQMEPRIAPHRPPSRHSLYFASMSAVPALLACASAAHARESDGVLSCTRPRAPRCSRCSVHVFLRAVVVGRAAQPAAHVRERERGHIADGCAACTTLQTWQDSARWRLGTRHRNVRRGSHVASGKSSANTLIWTLRSSELI